MHDFHRWFVGLLAHLRWNFSNVVYVHLLCNLVLPKFKLIESLIFCTKPVPWSCFRASSPYFLCLASDKRVERGE